MHPFLRRIWSLGTVAGLLVALAGPLAARESSIDVGATEVESAVVAEPETLEVAEAAPLPGRPEIPLYTAAWAGEAEAWSETEAGREAAIQQDVAPRRGGFGRWLKKHWYVPVLVGVAIGVVAFDDDADDDSED